MAVALNVSWIVFVPDTFIWPLDVNVALVAVKSLALRVPSASTFKVPALVESKFAFPVDFKSKPFLASEPSRTLTSPLDLIFISPALTFKSPPAIVVLSVCTGLLPLSSAFKFSWVGKISAISFLAVRSYSAALSMFSSAAIAAVAEYIEPFSAEIVILLSAVTTAAIPILPLFDFNVILLAVNDDGSNPVWAELIVPTPIRLFAVALRSPVKTLLPERSILFALRIAFPALRSLTISFPSAFNFKLFSISGASTLIFPLALIFAFPALRLSIASSEPVPAAIITASPSTTVSGVPFLTRSMCSVIDAISTTSPATLIL